MQEHSWRMRLGVRCMRRYKAADMMRSFLRTYFADSSRMRILALSFGIRVKRAQNHVRG